MALSLFCGITIRCLYADKGFCSVAVLQRLQRDAILAVIVMPRRGPQLRALCTGPESHWASHTLQRAADGAVTVKVAVVRTFPRTRKPRRRATWCLFVCLGICDSLIGIRQRYRKRFGIERTYRQLEQLRIRTTSPNPALRLMVVGIALVLLNVWVWAQWHYLRTPGRGPRRGDQAIFQLRRFQTFLLAALTAIYGQRASIDLAAYQPARWPTPNGDILLKGLFSAFRNPHAHEARIHWPINEQDALDILSLIYYIEGLTTP